MTSLRDLEILDEERERSRMRSMCREVSRLLLIMLGALFLILTMAVIASAGVVRKQGWQIHIFYAQPVDNRAWNTIGPPLPTKEFCEETAFPILIERIKDRVRCVYVDELYEKR